MKLKTTLHEKVEALRSKCCCKHEQEITAPLITQILKFIEEYGLASTETDNEPKGCECCDAKPLVSVIHKPWCPRRKW